jgi:hypothetical protein
LRLSPPFPEDRRLLRIDPYEAPGEPIQIDPSGKAPTLIKASPFKWIDPRTIPARQWLYGNHLIRKFVSLTVAPGGVGKSTLVTAELLSLASGLPFLGIMPPHRCRVWWWCGEDPKEELDRRIMAAAIHHRLRPEDIEGWLFCDSGREMEIVLAHQTKSGTIIAEPVVEQVTETILKNKIDVFTVDPFVSSHRVTENDNMAIDGVAKTWAKIANDTGCAIDLVHHVRKLNGAEVSVEDGRGAVALLAAARAARTLNGMSEEEASSAGIEKNKRRSYFRVDNGKSNLAPAPERSDWFELVSVELGNGDNVGAVAPWKWPDHLSDVSVNDLRKVQEVVAAGQWRDSVQSRSWVGNAVSEAMKFDVTYTRAKAKIKGLLKIWKSKGMLIVVNRPDEKRNLRPFVEVGEWAND